MRHIRSIRPLFLLFLGPLFQNAIMMTWVILMNFKAVAEGAPSSTLCYIGICMAIGYTASSYVAGRWITVKSATPVIAISTVLAALTGLLIIWIPPFWPYLILGFVLGLINGHYFCPFQVGMGSVKPFRTLAWTIAFYNVSWGTGVAIGPYVAGVLADLPKEANGLPPKTPFLILAISLAIVHTLLVLIARSAPPPSTDTTEPAPTDATPQPPVAPVEALIVSTSRLRKLGILCSFVGQFLLQSIAMSLWPPMAHAEGLSVYQQGIALAMMGIQIPLGALLFATQRSRMSRPWMLLAMLVVSAGAFLCLPFVTVWPWHLVVMALLGFACSGLFFHGVYYPNADRENPRRSVAMMEMTVGIAGFAGPLVMGNLAGNRETAWWPYAIGAGLILVLTAVALKIWLNGEDPLPAPAPAEA